MFVVHMLQNRKVTIFFGGFMTAFPLLTSAIIV